MNNESFLNKLSEWINLVVLYKIDFFSMSIIPFVQYLLYFQIPKILSDCVLIISAKLTLLDQRIMKCFQFGNIIAKFSENTKLWS